MTEDKKSLLNVLRSEKIILKDKTTGRIDNADELKGKLGDTIMKLRESLALTKENSCVSLDAYVSDRNDRLHYTDIASSDTFYVIFAFYEWDIFKISQNDSSKDVMIDGREYKTLFAQKNDKTNIRVIGPKGRKFSSTSIKSYHPRPRDYLRTTLIFTFRNV